MNFQTIRAATTNIINEAIDALEIDWGKIEGSSFKEKISRPHNWGVLSHRLFVVGVPVCTIAAVAFMALSFLSLIFPIGLLASIPLQCAAVLVIASPLVPAGVAKLIQLTLQYFQKK